MRNLSLGATLVASILSLTLSSVAWGQVAPRAPAAAAPASAGTSVAVIDIKYIFENNPRFKGAMEGVAKEAKQFDEYALDQRNKITKRGEQLKALEAGSPDYKRLEEEIAGMHTDLQLQFSRKQRELADRRSKIFFEAYKEIERHVQDFSERNGIDMVLRFDSSEMDENNRESVFQGVNRGVVYQRERDITKHVLERLSRATATAPGATAAPAAAAVPRTGAGAPAGAGAGPGAGTLPSAQRPGGIKR